MNEPSSVGEAAAAAIDSVDRCCSGNNNNSEERERREILFLRVRNTPFTIDRDDYLTVSSIVAQIHPSSRDQSRGVRIEEWVANCCSELGHTDRRVRELVLRANSVSDGPENIWGHEIQRLSESLVGLRVKNLHLPASVGKLKNLKKLCVEGGIALQLEELPESIWEIEGLASLSITRAKKLREISASIERLRNSLRSLSILHSGLRSLPSCIGKLHQLEVLKLDCVPRLTDLPPGIWDLSNLTHLSMIGCKLVSIPPSIGRLKKLEILSLPSAKSLTELPEEIGLLASLKSLDLQKTKIRALPESIANLANLQDLWLEDSAIASLPPPLLDGKLAKLSRVSLFETPLLRGVDAGDFLVRLVRACPSLTGLPDTSLSLLSKRDLYRISYALGCNRVRARGIFSISVNNNNNNNTDSRNASPFLPLPRLWPRLLENATRALDCRPSRYPEITRPDAIFRLLLDGKESFVVGVLSVRNERVESGLVDRCRETKVVENNNNDNDNDIDISNSSR